MSKISALLHEYVLQNEHRPRFPRERFLYFNLSKRGSTLQDAKDICADLKESLGRKFAGYDIEEEEKRYCIRVNLLYFPSSSASI